MKKVMLFLCVVVIAQVHAASSYGIFEWGLPTALYSAKGVALGGSGAAILDDSHSLINPAKTAFNTNTSFMALMNFESTEYGSTVENTFNIPYVAMDIPIGFMGNVGVAYFQKYTKSFHSKSELKEISFDGAYSEIIPSWSITFLDRFAVGFNYHIPYGVINIVTENESVSESKQVQFDSEFEPGLFTVSSQYSAKGWSVYAGFQLPHTITQAFEGEVVVKLLESDTITSPAEKHERGAVPYSYSVTQDQPLEVNAGLAYRVGRNHQFAFDGAYQAWGGIESTNPLNVSPEYATLELNDAYRMGIGYELTPSFRTFDLYFKRIAYRVGINVSQLYVYNAKEVQGSVGVGLPLGTRRVSNLDVTFQMGYRGLGADKDALDEYTMGLFVSFTGFGNWGKSSRRYR